jgi:hypothetical protein
VHLKRWEEIASVIEKNQDLRKYLHSLPENSDLRRHSLWVFSYGVS